MSGPQSSVDGKLYAIDGFRGALNRSILELDFKSELDLAWFGAGGGCDGPPKSYVAQHTFTVTGHHAPHSDAVALQSASYSYRSASMGLRREACTAGYAPKRTPTPVETPNARMTEAEVMIVDHPAR